MDEIGKAHGKTITQVGLNWLMQQSDCVIPIPGAKNLKQVKENIGALGWHLTVDELNLISQTEISCR